MIAPRRTLVTSRRRLLAVAGAASIAPLVDACADPATAQRDATAAAIAALEGLEALRPEDFGATGRGEDQTRALAALMAEARRRVRARIVLRADAVYAGTNPFVWGGTRELLIEGHGAQLTSARTQKPPGSIDANFAPFRSPTAVLPNGVDPLDFGPLQGDGKTDLGVRLRSAAKGAMFFTAPPTARICAASPPASGIRSAPAAISSAACSSSTTIPIHRPPVACCMSSKGAITASNSVTVVPAVIPFRNASKLR